MMDAYRDDPIEEDERDWSQFGSTIGVDAYVSRTEERELGNDQDRHVSPTDNDGETVPEDEVVDPVGG